MAPSSPGTAVQRPVAIEVRGVNKTFEIPTHRIDSLKERVTHFRADRSTRTLDVLRDIDFDVHQGEFFGIVGRNGSGKSTLLKILASIYRADSGRVRMAGRLAPFIELGVGFNPELTSRENVVLNGVLMGLSRRQASSRLDQVLDFAELREFADLKLKNYSSGMMVRLAFAIMVEADADIMLIDEVLAVGDAAFAQKCMDVFRSRRAAGKTIVLVTHDMSAVQGFCDRAMLIHDARQVYLGDPQETALRYFRLNFAGVHDETPQPGGVPDVNVRLVDAWLEDEHGARTDNVEQDVPLRFHAIYEARLDLPEPIFGLHFQNSDGQTVFGFNRTLEEGELVPAGERVHISGTIENRLLPGRYTALSWLSRARIGGDIALHVMPLLDFVVFGTRNGPGSMEVGSDLRAELE